MSDRQQWIRSLQGDLSPDESRQLQRELREDPASAAAYRQLAETWNRLELPPPSSVPEGFRAGVLDSVRQDTRHAIRPAPVWARAGAAAALLMGVVLGASLGTIQPPGTPGEDDEVLYLAQESVSLAEAYWLTFDDDGFESTGGE